MIEPVRKRLKLKVRVRSVSKEGTEEVTLYVISGLSADDSCIVGCAGAEWNGNKKWYLRWERSGTRLDTPELAYKTPQRALKAAAELWAKGF